MADKIDPSQIKRAQGGVKLKSKAPRPEKPKPKRPQIINDVKPDLTNQQIEPPTEEAAKLISKLNNAKQELISVMREFGKLLNVKTLPSNKSDKEKEHESRIIDELIRAAITVDRINPEQQEGVLSLSVFAARLSLLLRDAGNKLAYEVQTLNNRLCVLEGEKPHVEEESEEEQRARKAKEYILKEAKKLGVKLSIEEG